MSAVVDGHEVAAGNVKLMKQMNIQAAVPTSVGTEIHVVVDGKYAGYILISDVVKPNAKEAINGLKARERRRSLHLSEMESMTPLYFREQI